MSTTARATTASRPGSGIVVGLLLLAAVAWAGTLAVAQQMGVMAGTMGLAIPAFLLVWLLMMVAMMLPAVAPVAQLYLRTIGRDRRALRVAGFLSGYLLVWTAAGLPAFGMAWGAQQLAAEHSGAARLAAAGTFLAVAVYQVSPLKDVCLKACRSPLGLLLRYASYCGGLRDVRAGAHHGLYCLGCCWVLFVALIALGTMKPRCDGGARSTADGGEALGPRTRPVPGDGGRRSRAGSGSSRSPIDGGRPLCSAGTDGHVISGGCSTLGSAAWTPR